MKPLEIIENLRKTDLYIKDIFLNGGCYQFHLFLKSLFPWAKPYITNDKRHVITRIGGYFYDITGLTDEACHPMNKDEINMAEKWSFAKNNLLKITECPVCEEPICI